LRHLIEHAGRLISKDELIEAVWPNVTVSDESLTRCVSDVRQALSDHEQCIIKTVPRRGYLFAASVSSQTVVPEEGSGKTEGVDASAAAVAPRSSQTPKNITTPIPPRETFRVIAIAVVVVAVLTAMGAAAWQMRSGILQALSGSQAAKQSPTISAPRLSIVVLPFTNLSGDPAQDYLADVITEELTTALSRISGTFVIARSTAFTYKGKGVDVKQIGRDLGVRYVVEGSEQHGGNRVRVSAHLVDAETGAHLWSDQFDADDSNSLQMQDEIVTHLADALNVPLFAVEAARLDRIHPGNMDAQDLAERCAAPIVQGRPRGADFSLCERALQIDHRNSWALAYLPYKYINRVLEGTPDPQYDIGEADGLVSRALAVDPSSYVAHAAKGWVHLLKKHPDEAIVEAERALALNPSFIQAYVLLCDAFNYEGQPEKTNECVDKALRLSPRDPARNAFYFEKGYANFMLHQDDQAIQWLRRAAAEVPDGSSQQLVLAAALAENGNEVEGRETLRHYLALYPGIDAKMVKDYTQRFSDHPVWLATVERLYEGLLKAGMPAECCRATVSKE
jgi:adenylate cyclase